MASSFNYISILLIALGVIFFFILYFFTGYLLSLRMKKIDVQLKPIVEEMEKLLDLRREFILQTVEDLSERKLKHAFDFEPYLYDKKDDLATTKDKQDLCLIVMKKIVIEEKGAQFQALEEEIQKTQNNGGEIFDNYNKLVVKFNAFYNIFFTRVFRRGFRPYPFLR